MLLCNLPGTTILAFSVFFLKIIRFFAEVKMKKILYTAFLAVFVFFAGCSNNSNDSIYGGFDDVEYDDSSSVPDNDSHSVERPDDAPKPGGGGSSGNGNQGGSSGSKDEDSEISDEETDEETQDNGSEGSDSDNGNNENPDSDSDGGNTGNPDENSENPDGNNDPDDENGIYASEPDVKQCVSGVPTDDEKQKVLDRINYLRSIHGLPEVVYDTEGDKITAECSLIIAATNIGHGSLQLSHTPDNSWKCFTQAAYDGCNSSNIHVARANYDLYSTDSTAIVDGFMRDENVDSVGHRRWLLDPWLGHISFGRADYFDGDQMSLIGSAIKVIHDDDTQPDISGLDIDFVAYPFEYYPKELYNDKVMMSLSVLKDKQNKFGNGTNINFSNAVIAILAPDNKTITVKGQKSDTEDMGISNNIRWFAEGIKTNTYYKVTVSNILINNVSTDYHYWFELK